MGGLAEGHLGTLPGERRPQGTLWGGCRGCGPSPCWLGGQWTPAHDRGARGQGTSLPCPWPVIYGTRVELGDAPGTLGRAEWVGRNSTVHSVDLLLEAQVWSPREVNLGLTSSCMSCQGSGRGSRRPRTEGAAQSIKIGSLGDSGASRPRLVGSPIFQRKETGLGNEVQLSSLLGIWWSGVPRKVIFLVGCGNTSVLTAQAVSEVSRPSLKAAAGPPPCVVACLLSLFPSGCCWKLHFRSPRCGLHSRPSGGRATEPHSPSVACSPSSSGLYFHGEDVRLCASGTVSLGGSRAWRGPRHPCSGGSWAARGRGDVSLPISSEGLAPRTNRLCSPGPWLTPGPDHLFGKAC